MLLLVPLVRLDLAKNNFILKSKSAKNDLRGIYKSIQLAANLPSKTNTQPNRVLHAFWFKGGPMPPLGFAKGGNFEVKEGHPDCLQIT